VPTKKNPPASKVAYRIQRILQPGPVSPAIARPRRTVRPILPIRQIATQHDKSSRRKSLGQGNQ
jgi:hypothetical protein